MGKTVIPEGYRSLLSLYETQKAISLLKRLFEDRLAGALRLHRVSAPLFVSASSGLNDDLNGVERPVSFEINRVEDTAQVVHSLAKWKRLALKRYQFHPGKGLFTDMNAIRRDEVVDNLHSIYVDQWDWEKVILREDRTESYLRQTVRAIMGAVCETNDALDIAFPSLHTRIDRDVYFISTQELEDRFPDLTPKQREDAICREHHTVFLMQIGGNLKRSGQPHDGRAPDYDDWQLNGDILLWNPVLERSFEISSMGIRVDEAALIARNRAPGLNRSFAAQHWAMVDKRIWLDAADEAMDNEFHDKTYEIWGGDIDPHAVEIARHNAELAEVDDTVRFEVDDATRFHWGGQYGRVVTNPPYGERLLEQKEAEELYRAFGRAVDKLPETWRVYVLSSHTEFERCFGRTADKKRKLYNGMLKCDLFMYGKRV